MPRRFVDDGDQAPVTRASQGNTSTSGFPRAQLPTGSRSSRSSPTGIATSAPKRSGPSSGGGKPTSLAFMLSQTPPRGNGNSRLPSPILSLMSHSSSSGNLRPSRTPSPSSSSSIVYRQKSPRSTERPISRATNEGTPFPPSLSRSSSVPSRTDDYEDLKPEILATQTFDDGGTWDESSSLSGDIPFSRGMNSSSSLSLSGPLARRLSLGASGGTLSKASDSSTPQPTTTRKEAVTDGTTSINSEEAVTKERPFLIPETGKGVATTSQSSSRKSGTDSASEETVPMLELQTRAVSYVLGEEVDEDDQYNLEDATRDVWGDPDEDRKMTAKEAKVAAARQMQRKVDADLSAEKQKQVSAMAAGIAAGVAMANSDGKKPSTPAISSLAATQAKAAERALMTPDERMAVDAKDKEKRAKERIREERAVAAAYSASISTSTEEAAAKPPLLEEQQIFSAPGAHRVAGINGSNSMSDLDYTVDGDAMSALQPSAAAESAMPSVFSAHVVDDVEAQIVSDDEEVGDYEPYVGEPVPTPPEPDHPIFVARPFDESTLNPDSVVSLVRNPRVQLLLCLTLVLFLGLIAGIIFGIVGINERMKSDMGAPPPTAAPTSFPYPIFALLERQLSQASLDQLLNDPNSPQARAWNWWKEDELSQEGNLQRFAMATLFFATEGQLWSNNDGWLSPQSECDWFTTSDLNACAGKEINHLELANLTLNGTIPEEIGLLTGVRVLDLSCNGLKGTIPPSLFTLSELKSLRIDSNSLTGTLATDFGKLGSLLFLDISCNELTGALPSELGLLSSVSTVVLGAITENEESQVHESSALSSTQRNRFDGGIPSELGLLLSLTTLVLSGSDNLRGSLPTELGQLTLLENLQVQQSSVGGSLPSELGRLPRLRRLELGSNMLTGSIPLAWAPLATTLRTLTLQENELTGTIPSFNWTSTRDSVLQIRLRCNKFVGEIPTSVCADFNPFLYIVAADCEVTGTCRCCYPCDDFEPCRERW